MRTDVAAFDDPRFVPERLQAAARAVLEEIVHVRNDKELVKVWNERFEPWLTRWDRRSRPLGVPGGWGARVVLRGIEVVTIRNLGPEAPAEATVRVRLGLRQWPRIPLLGWCVRTIPPRDTVLWLTLLAPPGGNWTLTRVDFGAAGEYHLAAETVTEPVRDPALHDAAVRELAAGDAVTEPGELIVGTQGDAARELLDLSLTDGRFAPGVIEAAVRSLIRAWRQLAIAGDEAFAALSSYEIAEYARDADLPARLHAIEILALVAQPRPALFIELAAVIQGSDGTKDHKLCWKLELDDALAQHWRLVDAYARPELRALRGE
jgi:hypothetical protein